MRKILNSLKQNFIQPHNNNNKNKLTRNINPPELRHTPLFKKKNNNNLSRKINSNKNNNNNK